MEPQINNNLSTPTSPQKRIWKWYLILSIIYSSIAILYGLQILMRNFYDFLPTLLYYSFHFIYIIWLWVSMAMLILIFVKRIERVALLLPILYLFDLIFSEIISLKFDLVVALNNPIAVASVLLLFPVATLGMAIYLIARK